MFKIFQRYADFMVFITLLLVGFVFVLQSHQYHRSKFIHSTQYIGILTHNFRYQWTQYLNLKQDNTALRKQNAMLCNQVTYYKDKLASLQDNFTKTEDTVDYSFTFTDDFQYDGFKVLPTTILKNDYRKSNNYFIIHKGSKDGIKPDMGVVGPDGILGIVEETNEKYSRVISVLNQSFTINAGLKKSPHYGSLAWDGKDPNYVSLKAIPKQANLKVGDTIITNGRSYIFPRGIAIGSVSSFTLDTISDEYKVQIKLFTDMTALYTAYVIFNADKAILDEISTP